MDTVYVGILRCGLIIRVNNFDARLNENEANAAKYRICAMFTEIL